MQITYEQARRKLRQGLPPSEKKISSMTNREWSWLMGNKPDWFGTGERNKKTGLRSFAPPNVYDDPNTLSGVIYDDNQERLEDALIVLSGDAIYNTITNIKALKKIFINNRIREWLFMYKLSYFINIH